MLIIMCQLKLISYSNHLQVVPSFPEYSWVFLIIIQNIPALSLLDSSIVSKPLVLNTNARLRRFLG